jgi:hypothetical protein
MNGTDHQRVARLVRRFWAARQREQLKDRRIKQLEAERDLLRIGLDRPPAPTPIPQAPPLLPPDDGLVMGALKVAVPTADPADCPNPECAGHLVPAAHDVNSGVLFLLCDTCPRTQRQLTKGNRP